MWVWFVGVAMGVAYVLEASLKKLAPMILSRGTVQPITCKVFNELVNNKLVPSPVSAF